MTDLQTIPQPNLGAAAFLSPIRRDQLFLNFNAYRIRHDYPWAQVWVDYHLWEEYTNPGKDSWQSMKDRFPESAVIIDGQKNIERVKDFNVFCRSTKKTKGASGKKETQAEKRRRFWQLWVSQGMYHAGGVSDS